MNYRVHYTAKNGTRITGEVVAEDGKMLYIFAVWRRNLDGSEDASLFWLPRKDCKRI